MLAGIILKISTFLYISYESIFQEEPLFTVVSAHTTYSAVRVHLMVSLLLVLPQLSLAQDGTEALKKDDKRLVYTLFDQLMELGAAAKEQLNSNKDTSSTSAVYNPDYKMQVFGWHGDFIGSAYQNYRFNSLTSLAYHSCRVVLRDDGYLEYDYGDWFSSSTQGLIHRTDADSCNMLLTLSCDDDKAIAELLGSEENRTQCVKFVSDLVTDRPEVEGLVISFEGMPFNLKAEFSEFIERMKKSLDVFDKALVLAIPPARGQNKYDLKTINQFVDQFVMLGYNYYYSDSYKPGPVSPLLHSKEWGELNVQQGVTEYLSFGVPANKLIVAFPYYGAMWEVLENENGKKSYRFYGNPPINEILELTKDEKVEMDEVAATAYCEFQNKVDGKKYIVFFDNADALKLKYYWVRSQKLAGIGMWTLGYDEGETQFWDLIESDVNVLKNYGLHDVVNDSIPTSEPPLTEAVAEADIRKILKQSEVQIVLLCTVLFFVLLGAFLALTSSTIFDRLLILEFRTYLKVLGIFLALMILLLFVSGFVFHSRNYLEDHHLDLVSSESVQRPLNRIMILGIVIISALSWKSFLRVNKDVP